jgi:hypothetical protein
MNSMPPARKLHVFLLIAPLTAFIAGANVASGATTLAEFDKSLLPYLQTHCLRCHNAEKHEGEFRLDTLSKNVGSENNPQWLEVIERINSGEMPPKSESKRPSAQESAQVVEWLAARMKEGEAARMASRARVTYNRLTRDEYVNTVRDLIGVEFDARDPGNFLEDPEWQGFERLGSVLTLSPSNIEKYLAAAETILNEAYPDPAVRRHETSGWREFGERTASRKAARTGSARQTAI